MPFTHQLIYPVSHIDVEWHKAIICTELCWDVNQQLTNEYWIITFKLHILLVTKLALDNDGVAVTQINVGSPVSNTVLHCYVNFEYLDVRKVESAVPSNVPSLKFLIFSQANILLGEHTPNFGFRKIGKSP